MGNPYFTIKKITRDSNYEDFLNILKSYTFKPIGNMYIITDYDTSLIESTYIDLIT